MGRAYPSSQQEYDQDAGDWQSLRGELAALLAEVEHQVSRSQQDNGYQGMSERMRDMRYQVGGAEPDRHREALRSVKRAVDRFSERDETYPAPRESFAGNPRDTLQSAIQQIRSRQMETAPPSPQQRAPEPPRVLDSPRFDELAQAVGGISGRLERLEAELRSSARSQTGNVKEIAEQVAQLSHVVELLAGAVGETGQVKRLESQIAGLAKLIAQQGQQVDLDAFTQRLDQVTTSIGKLMERQDGASGFLRQQGEGMTQRLDDVTATMGRLADLQVQFANRVDNSAKAAYGLREGVVSIENHMRAIEESVRNVYDRIDMLEKGNVLSRDDVDRLTDEMARFTEAMKNPVQPQGLVELIDALNTRIASIESTDRNVGGLKADIGALRIAVVEAIEPRFAALEMQLEQLNDRVSERPADLSVGQLEAQVRQLVARMDQTGEQLTGLARMYTQPAEREPDYEALADMVAARTSEAVAQHAPAMSPPPVNLDIDEIERRVQRLLDAAQRERPSEELNSIENSIAEVTRRLTRLESSLMERAREAERIASLPVEPMPVVPESSYEAPAEFAHGDPITPLLDEAAHDAMYEARGEMRGPRDYMPANPGYEAPLVDKPFGDAGPLKAALDAKNGPRKHHPGLSYDPLPGQGADIGDLIPPESRAARPDFNPDNVERPPRPVSSFDNPALEPFVESSGPSPVAEPASGETPSTNTFIAAARRAAQRQQAAGKPTPGTGNSLIARAFANFQAATTPKPAEEKAEKPAKVEKAAKPAKPPKAEKPPKESRKDKKRRLLAGDKEPTTEWRPEDDVVAAAMPEPAVIRTAPMPPPPLQTGPTAPGEISIDQESTSAIESKPRRQSFLLRHRRPILLAASVVAIAFLALNLIQQRMARSEPEPATAADVSALDAETPTPSPLAAEPMATIPAAVTGPRVIPIVDSLATASIDPAAARGFTPTADVKMPSAFTAAAQSPMATAAEDAIQTAALTPDAIIEQSHSAMTSPVQVEMPPDTLGPEPLRAAAAHGDARAQFEIAAIYTEGRAVAEDLAAAAVWYERAAAQGFAPAQYRLGNLYENGQGVTKDLEMAKLWYQRAADAGNRMAMHNLAALYASGGLGRQEFDAAAEWFEQAAMRGMRDSQFNLGMLFARGLGVTQSLEESYRWFAIAAARGDADAGKARDDVARSLDAATVARLNDEVKAYLPQRVDLVANFAPIGTWVKDFDPGETITNTEVIKSVQLALTALGYDVGTPDGLAGPKTADAIREFERSTGMNESGAVNPRLLAVLGSQPV